MPTYSQNSQIKLASCDPRIQLVFNKLILFRDCTVTCGHRGEKEQEEAFRAGTSTKHFGQSRHNTYPSLAIDVIPFPCTPKDWNNRIFWIEWSSWVKGFAHGLGVDLISGYDWDNDNNYSIDEQNLWDGPHFQLNGGPNGNQSG